MEAPKSRYYTNKEDFGLPMSPRAEKAESSMEQFQGWEKMRLRWLVLAGVETERQ